MKTLTRELEAVNRFTQVAFQFVGTLEDERLRGFAAQFVDGITVIGESELNARQMERCQVLGIQPARRDFARERFRELNDRGREIILSSIPKLRELGEDAGGAPSGKKKSMTRAEVKQWKDRLYTLLVDVEMKASDVRQIQASIDDYAKVMTAKGPKGVASLMEKQVRELHRFRGQSGRGATTNIAIWKAIAIAVFIGVSLWAIFKCSIFGCSIIENLAYGTIALIALVVVFFC